MLFITCPDTSFYSLSHCLVYLVHQSLLRLLDFTATNAEGLVPLQRWYAASVTLRYQLSIMGGVPLTYTASYVVSCLRHTVLGCSENLESMDKGISLRNSINILLVTNYTSKA